MNIETLKKLDRAERKAWLAMLNGPIEDACSIYGKEGKNYLAYLKAADACWDARVALGIRGKRGY